VSSPGLPSPFAPPRPNALGRRGILRFKVLQVFFSLPPVPLPVLGPHAGTMRTPPYSLRLEKGRVCPDNAICPTAARVAELPSGSGAARGPGVSGLKSKNSVSSRCKIICGSGSSRWLLRVTGGSAAVPLGPLRVSLGFTRALPDKARVGCAPTRARQSRRHLHVSQFCSHVISTVAHPSRARRQRKAAAQPCEGSTTRDESAADGSTRLAVTPLPP